MSKRLFDRILTRAPKDSASAKTQQTATSPVKKRAATARLFAEADEVFAAASRTESELQQNQPQREQLAYEADLGRRIGTHTEPEWQEAERVAAEGREALKTAEAERMAAGIERDKQRAILELLHPLATQELAGQMLGTHRGAVLDVATALVSFAHANEALHAIEEDIKTMFPSQSHARKLAKLPGELGIDFLAIRDFLYDPYNDGGGAGRWQLRAHKYLAGRPAALETVDQIGVLQRAQRGEGVVLITPEGRKHVTPPPLPSEPVVQMQDLEAAAQRLAASPKSGSSRSASEGGPQREERIARAVRAAHTPAPSETPEVPHDA